MCDPAATRPFPLCQREIAGDAATRRAQPRRGEETSNHRQMLALPAGLVGNLEAQHRPSRIVNAFGQVGFPEALHVQVFYHAPIVVAHEPGREFVDEVTALVGDPPMLAGNLHTGLLAVLAAPLTAGQVPPKPAQLAFGPPVVLGGRNAPPVTQHDQVFQSNVQTHHPLGSGRGQRRVGQLEVDDQGDVPGPRRVLLERRTLDHTVERPVQHQSDRADFRNGEPVADECHPLRDAKGWRLTFLGAEARELCPSSEEGPKRFVEVADRLLEGLRVHATEPFRLGLALEVRDLGAQLSHAQTLARGLIVRDPSSKRPVVHPPSRPRELPKLPLLRAAGRVCCGASM